MRRRGLWLFATVLLALCATTAFAEPKAPAADEAATARRLAAIRHRPGLLRAFLREMPKGGDLHNHLSGGIYAESFIEWAIADKLCLATATLAIVAPPCDAATAKPPIADAVKDVAVYNQLIDSLSMRNWEAARSGHEHFFASFSKFGPPSSRYGDMLAEAAAHAAAEHVTYLELMLGIDGGVANRLAQVAGWDGDAAGTRKKLLDAGFQDQVRAAARQRLDAAEARKNEVLHCGTPQADPGCGVTIRFIQQVLRATPLEQVFAQMLAGLEIASGDPRVVAINPVQPEDDPTALRDFTTQMKMLDYLHGVYPNVALTLHAGELADGLVPPPALRFHIRQSVEVGHAQRIGHGVSVLSEDDALGLLREMASKHVLVEIALTSNDTILGVRGSHHPLATYLEYRVPVALVTDDAGVARSTHTQEFAKAVEEQGLDYRTLKQMVRNSVQYAFADPATKARLSGDLETALRAFERRQARLAATR